MSNSIPVDPGAYGKGQPKVDHEDKVVWYAVCDSCETIFHISRHRDAAADLPEPEKWGGMMGDSFTCLVCDDQAILEGTDTVRDVFK